MKAFERSVASYIARHRLLPDGARALVALSGGADSVALLRVLIGLGYGAEAAHCNFHLRGEESERDEAFVRELCEELSVPLHVQAFDTQAHAKSHGMSIEMAARELRYGWFRELAKALGFNAIAVAHHRDDNAETLLLNLVRGTGLRGLCGMQPRVEGRGKGEAAIVRPLLGQSKQDILTYLGALGQPFVTDSTNACTDIARNRLRHIVLPELRKLNPAADDNIATTIANLAEALKVYDCFLGEMTGASLDGWDAINIGTVLRSPSPLSVLHALLTPFGFRRSQLVQLLDSVEHVGAEFVSATHRVVVDREQLLVAPLEVAAPSAALTFTHLSAPVAIDPSPTRAYIDEDWLGGPLSVRRWQQGDHFVPLGMEGSKLVSDFLTDLKLSRLEKERQDVLVCEGEIVWVVGRRLSQHFRVRPETRRVLVVEVEAFQASNE